MAFLFDNPTSSGCKACDGLSAMTEGRVRFCRRHNPDLSAEDRKKCIARYEKLLEIHKAAGIEQPESNL